jgi:hypothetical protein
VALEGFTDGFGVSLTLAHRFDVPQQMRPTALTPSHGIPMVGTPAIRGQAEYSQDMIELLEALLDEEAKAESVPVIQPPNVAQSLQ